jgi:heat-inducible transcriptional repressor
MRKAIGRGEADDRNVTVLCAVVDNYIAMAEPVGSRTLSKIMGLGLSPATIRNVMADLTELGYLEQPHTSAGRIPTDRAYRFYVDTRALDGTVPDELKQDIQEALSAAASSGLKELLVKTTKVLSGLTKFAGIAATPHMNATRLKVIEFLRLGSNKVCVVLITVSNQVHHRIIEVSEDLPREFLRKISRYLNERFANQSLAEVRERVLESLMEEKEHYDQLLAQVLRLSKKAFDLPEERELYVDGKINLTREFNDVDKIQRLLQALEEKMAIITLLDQTMEPDQVNIAIGLENPVLDLQDCTVVTASYGDGERPMGTIGVIGPTRMNYSRVIPIIQYTAQTLSQAIANQ